MYMPGLRKTSTKAEAKTKTRKIQILLWTEWDWSTPPFFCSFSLSFSFFGAHVKRIGRRAGSYLEWVLPWIDPLDACPGIVMFIQMFFGHLFHTKARTWKIHPRPLWASSISISSLGLVVDCFRPPFFSSVSPSSLVSPLPFSSRQLEKKIKHA
jgi:hypothetical protein